MVVTVAAGTEEAATVVGGTEKIISREVIESMLLERVLLLRGQLYDAAWIDDNTIERKRRQGISLPPRKS